MRWQYREQSPNSGLTGNWKEAERVLSAQEKWDTWRLIRVTRVDDESAVIRTFYLESADQSGLLDYKPGQYLTIRVTPENGKKQIRTYTLSSAPDDSQYRISVKRESGSNAPGDLVSNFLHHAISVGDIIEATSPRGDFWIDTTESRPAALFSAGVGITPMLSMACQAVSDGVRRRHLRPMTILHSTQSTTDRAFTQEFADLQKPVMAYSAMSPLLRIHCQKNKPARNLTLPADYPVK